MARFVQWTALVAALLVIGITGCGSKTKTPTSKNKSGEDAHAHSHAEEGPHGGSLIEIGEEEFHAELVHDTKAGTATVYILDSAAKASVPIEATEITINLKHDGKGEQLKLAASPDANDAQGKSSRFVSSDAELTKYLHDEAIEAELAVTINSKPYRSKIEHAHHHDH
jgi:hypothetical protein